MQISTMFCRLGSLNVTCTLYTYQVHVTCLLVKRVVRVLYFRLTKYSYLTHFQ